MCPSYLAEMHRNTWSGTNLHKNVAHPPIVITFQREGEVRYSAMSLQSEITGILLNLPHMPVVQFQLLTGGTPMVVNVILKKRDGTCMYRGVVF